MWAETAQPWTLLTQSPPNYKNVVKPKDQLSGLLDSLELLVSQAKAYARALPPDNYPARVAVNTLGELAKQALKEAQDLTFIIDPPESGDHPFTNRELQVLNLAAQGLTNKEIAYCLGMINDNHDQGRDCLRERLRSQ
jgi:DNA-binding NarL/FixJ family response regulator